MKPLGKDIKGPPYRFGYLGYAASVVAAASLSLVLLYLSLGLSGRSFFIEEGGPLEWLQIVLWLLSCGLGFALFLRARTPLDRMTAFWLTVVGLLAMAREFDAQVLLNPETIGSWGLRYRIDWWLSTDASVLLRLFWLGVFLLLGAALTVPLFHMKIPFVRLVRSGDVASGLFVLSILFLFLGFACDDLLRETTLLAPHKRSFGEETFELAGAGAYLSVVIALMKRHPSVRCQALNRPRQPQI